MHLLELDVQIPRTCFAMSHKVVVGKARHSYYGEWHDVRLICYRARVYSASD